MVHSGSRHLGLEVAEHYQSEGYRALNGNFREDQQKLIMELEARGREKEIQKALKELKNGVRTAVPRQLAYVEGPLFEK